MSSRIFLIFLVLLPPCVGLVVDHHKYHPQLHTPFQTHKPAATRGLPHLSREVISLANCGSGSQKLPVLCCSGSSQRCFGDCCTALA
ncbi:hypothetical protein QBC35DRAFT_144192 [Podospora australis]|uniref:Conotoxin n=1 Tax=Podospora australis TaxID=1536484 RepID=A0AAN6WXG7_9PEZI|nr:hypothetical protein QBC35DRAFT_144192 [Podospora australis]